MTDSTDREIVLTSLQNLNKFKKDLKEKIIEHQTDSTVEILKEGWQKSIFLTLFVFRYSLEAGSRKDKLEEIMKHHGLELINLLMTTDFDSWKTEFERKYHHEDITLENQVS